MVLVGNVAAALCLWGAKGSSCEHGKQFILAFCLCIIVLFIIISLFLPIL